MRGVVCLLEAPCGRPREMGLGQERTVSPIVRPWAYSVATEKALEGRTRAGPPGAPKRRVGIGMANGEGGSKKEYQGKTGASEGVLPVNPLHAGSRCPG